MQTPLQQVLEFHKAFGAPVGASPRWITDRLELRLALIDEERDELDEALNLDWGNDGISYRAIRDVADALGDMVYVIYGMAIEMGIDLDAVVAEIHRSNMSKLGEDGQPILREDGKILKGPNYSPPDIARVLFGCEICGSNTDKHTEEECFK